MKYVALLRGINVGKSVQVPMERLRLQFEGIGLTEVITYLNSGNVIFSSDASQQTLSGGISELLEREYGQKNASIN